MREHHQRGRFPHNLPVRPQREEDGASSGAERGPRGSRWERGEPGTTGHGANHADCTCPRPPESADPALWPLTFSTPSTTEAGQLSPTSRGVGQGPAGTAVSAHLTQQGRCGLPGTHPGELVTELTSVECAAASAAPRGAPLAHAGPKEGPPTQQTQHRPQGGRPPREHVQHKYARAAGAYQS